MTNILAIAGNTFREAIRKKVFYLILIFIVVMLGVSVAMATVALDGVARVMITLGLFSINVFALLVVVFVGSQLIADETDRKTIYTAVSHGVRRWEFIIGKWLGLYGVIAVLMVVMTVLLWLLFWTLGVGVDDFAMVKCVILLLLQMMMISGVVMMFASFSTPVLTAVLTVLVWVICNFTLDIENHALYLQQQAHQYLQPILYKALYVLLPNFAQYNEIRSVIYPQDPVVVAPLLVVAAVLYTIVFLSLASFAFSRKDFE